ncbi:hypothetical protein [Magnetovibrio sp.]|uniref:hypothetical protein n=1 Tax=Magnetovibrio sp. TaxID=2024836 RepID=UPI002F9203D5
MMTDRRHVLKIGLGAVLAAALAGCASDAQLAGPVPEVGFQHLSPIHLKVARVEVRSDYQSPMTDPNAEHRFSTPPAKAMSNWATRRLQAVGTPGGMGGGTATFVIEDAAVIETQLNKSTGLKGAFTYEPTERYDANIAARLMIADGQNNAQGEVKVSAKRSVEVRENATLAERERAWFEMTEALMADFNAQMENQIQAHLRRWLDGPGI